MQYAGNGARTFLYTFNKGIFSCSKIQFEYRLTEEHLEGHAPSGATSGANPAEDADDERVKLDP